MYGQLAFRVGIILSFLLVFYGCQKEEIPYEYPEDPIPSEPELITHFQRGLRSGEVWTKSNSEENCKGSLATINYAFFDIDTSRGFATMHLIPDSSSCELQVSMQTEIQSDEITSVEWIDLEFEFTFSELILNSETELWLNLKYKELDMKIDFAPLILSVDSAIENGLIEISQDLDGINYYVNGVKVKPNMELPGNSASLTGSETDQHVGVDLISQSTNQQSLLVFQFMRITSFTIPES